MKLFPLFLRGLASQLIFLILLMSLALGGLSFALYTALELDDFKQRHQTATQQTLQLYLPLAQNALDSPDEVAAKSITESLTRHPHIRQARIEHHTGTTLAESGELTSSNNRQNWMFELLGAFKPLEVRLEIRQNDALRGYIVVLLDESFLIMEWGMRWKVFLLLELLNLLVIGAVLWWMLTHTLTRPLRQIRAHIQQHVPHTEKALVAIQKQPSVGPIEHIPFLQAEEFHELVEAINQLLKGYDAVFSDVSTAYDTLEFLNDNLNQLVERLELSEKKYRSIFENAEEGIFQTNPDGAVVMANPALAKMVGYDVESLQQANLRDLYVDPAQREEMLSVVKQYKKIKHYEVQLYHKDGSVVNIALNAHAIYDNQGELILLEGLAENISEQKEIEDLRMAKELAESTTKAKTLFLENMSQEILAPLKALLAATQMLTTEVQSFNLAEHHLQYLHTILKNGQRLSELIHNILDLSKIEAGKLEVQPDNLNLNILMHAIYHVNRAECERKSLDFRYELDPTLPEVIVSDRLKLNQILMNLISNAIKYTPNGKSVLVKASREDPWLRFEVIDQGVGIPPHHLKQIFKPFVYSESDVFRSYGGRGLGLAITKSLVELLEGSLGVDSLPSTGTHFWVRIPLKEGVTVESELILLQSRQTLFGGNPLILIADDDDTSRIMARAFLKKLNLEVCEAVNGLQAYEIALKQKPDLVLMDLQMPVLDGFETIKKFQENHQLFDVPIIALHTSQSHQQIEQAIKAGACEYLNKPLELARLSQVLSRYLPSVYQAPNLENPMEWTAEKEQQMLDELQKLSEMPLYYLAKVLNQIKKMEKICEARNNYWQTILEDIKSAVTAKEPHRAESIIMHLLQKH